MPIVLQRLLLTTALVAATPAVADPILTVYPSADPKLALGQVAFDGGKTLDLTVGIGSGAFRRADRPANQFVTVSDRGPNFTCGDAKDIIGIDGKTFCGDVKQGRIYPMPDYSPAIYRIEVGDKGFTVLEEIKLKDAGGKPLSGLPNTLTVATTENPLDARAQPLQRSAGSVDAEGIVELSDGSFWIGDENAPSILHVGADGTVQKRIVPAGTEGDFAAAGYPVEGKLPAILARRQANRGIESMAVSADEAFLYFMMQSPLANPDADTYANATNARLFKFDRAKGEVVGEYVYTMTPMAEFPGETDKKANTARVSELVYLGTDRLLVDDRTDKTTKLFELDLSRATNILGSKWDDPATSPSLEQIALAEAGIEPVGKKLVLDSSNHPELPGKIEGVSFFGDGALMLISDDDFGIAGASTAIIRVEGLALSQ
ncbi:MAG: esterase-like activity of phytase family protein [Geminicoccaceae bacterium]